MKRRTLMRRGLALLLGTVMTAGIFAGTVGAEEESLSLTMYDDASWANQDLTKRLLGKLKEETGIEVTVNVLPGKDTEIFKKLDVNLMSGDTVDLIRLPNTNFQKKYTDAKFIEPLNELAEEAGYDMEETFGKYLVRADDGEVYYLPLGVSMSCVFYNKKIFDEAGVPYPENGWTWDEYIETAKKLTDKDKGIYGSLMQNWEYYLYNQAHQKGVADYKEDGTSNFDDPAFAEALKWYEDLSAVHGIQPSWIEYNTRKINWDSFMTGNYGMTYVGSWHLGLFGDYMTYPRDWEVGVVTSPRFGDNDCVLANTSAFAINVNSKNKKTAFKAIAWLAENWSKYNQDIPALTSVTPENIRETYQDFCDSVNNEISPDDIYNVFVDNGFQITDEKIVGTGAAQINDMYVKEAELYLIGENSLEDTMKNIKEKADEIISEETAE